MAITNLFLRQFDCCKDQWNKRQKCDDQFLSEVMIHHWIHYDDQQQ